MRGSRVRASPSDATRTADGHFPWEREPDFRAAVQHRENARRQSAVGERALDGEADEFGCAGMRGVRLHDHGAACGERARRVATGDGKREGKIARAENDDGAERDEHPAQIGLGHGLAIGQRGIDARVAP